MSGKEMHYVQEAFDINWAVQLGSNVDAFDVQPVAQNLAFYPTGAEWHYSELFPGMNSTTLAKKKSTSLSKIHTEIQTILKCKALCRNFCIFDFILNNR
jgi:hypothetical protein